MKLLTRKTDYAVRALCYIAEKSDKISVTELTKKLNIPYHFLRKILKTLTNAGVLVSSKGKNGGFLLSKSTNQICIKKIIEIFRGKINVSDCLINKNICPDVGNCMLRNELTEINNQIENRFKSMTIASLKNNEE